MIYHIISYYFLMKFYQILNFTFIVLYFYNHVKVLLNILGLKELVCKYYNIYSGIQIIFDIDI